MATSRFEIRVGVFVLIGLILLAALTVLFSKGMNFDWDIYQVNLRTSTVGGLQERAAVLMSGVKIGSVSEITLARDGKSVVIGLKIDKRITIYPDAQFVIEQAGFLGDQYVAIIPTKNEGTPLKNGAEVVCEAPFNMLDMARTASGLMVRIDEAAKKLDGALTDLRTYALNDQTLSNLSVTVSNMRDVSDHALNAVDGVNTFVMSNSAPMAVSISNLNQFSEQMSRFSGTLSELGDTNRADVTAAIQNLRTASESMKSLLANLQAGKGLAGELLAGTQLVAQVSQVANNLAITSSNLNTRGLWGILWSPKPPRTNAPPRSIYTGRDPFK